MTIYECYLKNNRKFGFLVTKKNWITLKARVISIEGITEGQPIPIVRVKSKEPGALHERRKVRVTLHGPGCFGNFLVTLCTPWKEDFKMIAE